MPSSGRLSARRLRFSLCTSFPFVIKSNCETGEGRRFVSFVNARLSLRWWSTYQNTRATKKLLFIGFSPSIRLSMQRGLLIKRFRRSTTNERLSSRSAKEKGFLSRTKQRESSTLAVVGQFRIANELATPRLRPLSVPLSLSIRI